MRITLISIYCTLYLFLSICHVQSSLAGTWRDDFEDNDTREWEIYNLVRQDEKWWINDNEAVGEIFKEGFWSLWLTGDLNWEYYSVSCIAMLIDEKNDPPFVGLSLHDRGEERMRYVFYIDYVWGLAVISKWTADGGTAVLPFVPEIDIWYQLKASVHKIEIEENGVLKEEVVLEFTVEDINDVPSFPPITVIAQDSQPINGGYAGLVVSGARARFDNVVITGDNIPNGGPAKRNLQPVTNKRKITTTWGNLKQN